MRTSSFTSFRAYGAAVIFLLTVLVANPLLAADSGYRINKGDKLKIDVWQEENLHAEVMVSPDGTFSFPMVGSIGAAGKTIDELQTLLRDRLEEYIPGPEVIVSLLTVEGNSIYVIGEVNRPGPYVMTKDMDIVQALSMAGGLTPFAAKNDVHVLRRTAEGRSSSIPFAYGDVEDGENLDTNILLQSGDTVIVP